MSYIGGDTMDESEKSQLEVIRSELTDIGRSLKRIEKTGRYQQVGNIGFGGMCAGMGLVAGSKFISEGVAIFIIGASLYLVSLFLPRAK